MQIRLMALLLILMVFTGCSKLDFDGFDPATTTVRWIMKGVNGGVTYSFEDYLREREMLDKKGSMARS